MKRNNMLQRYGAKIRAHAPGQHARMIERRGAILRHSLHTAEEQFAREGIEVAMEYLLADSVFSGQRTRVSGRRYTISRPLRVSAADAAGYHRPSRRYVRRTRQTLPQNKGNCFTANYRRHSDCPDQPSNEKLDYSAGRSDRLPT